MRFIKNKTKTFNYVSILLLIIVLFTAIACYFYFKSDNAVGPNLITAFVGVVLSALVTLVLLNGQTKDEENKERKKMLYNSKLQVYSDFISKMYSALSDGHITSDELQELRTKLFATVGFYAGEDVLMGISKLMEEDFGENGNISISNNIDEKIPFFFSKITGILQNDTKEKNDTKRKGNGTEGKEIVSALWNKFQIIINVLKEQEEQEKENTKKERAKEERWLNEEKQDNQLNNKLEDNLNTKKETVSSEEHNFLKQQSWHFNAWDGTQLKQLEELDELDEDKEYELSLVEYGEYWRTNLVKQVGEGDIIMLYLRGGYGYVGAFKAIGRRVFYFEKDGNGREEVLYYAKEPEIITEKESPQKFEEHVDKYDIYKSREDGATLCANLIVKLIAFVPEGVGNPGGVYRRTISRYDSHYAWLLKKRFQEKGQWLKQ